jgi:tRNA threonylcarbamoyladenosine modification (KEOPS) complex Cgi121 subunit
MIKPIEEYERFVEISGFRGVNVKDAKEFSNAVQAKLPRGCGIQLFDADFVATWQHLYFATVNALMNFRGKRSISKSLAVETALYASGQGQIQKAIEQIGVKPETRNVAVVVICEKAESAVAGLEAVATLLGSKPDESVLDLTPKKTEQIKKAFDISDAELDAVSTRGRGEVALVDLVVERVALLSTRL